MQLETAQTGPVVTSATTGAPAMGRPVLHEQQLEIQKSNEFLPNQKVLLSNFAQMITIELVS